MHTYEAITVIYPCLLKENRFTRHFGSRHSLTVIVMGAFNDVSGSSSHPGLWMVLPDPIVWLRMSWSFCNLNGQAKFMYCFTSHSVGPLRLCCFICLFLCEVIFLLNWGGEYNVEGSPHIDWVYRILWEFNHWTSDWERIQRPLLSWIDSNF